MERSAAKTTPGPEELEGRADGVLTKMEKRHNDMEVSRDVAVTSLTPVKSEVRPTTEQSTRTTTPGRGELEVRADGPLMEKRHNDAVEASRGVTSVTPVKSAVRSTTTKMELEDQVGDVSGRVTRRLEHDERTWSSPALKVMLRPALSDSRTTTVDPSWRLALSANEGTH